MDRRFAKHMHHRMLRDYELRREKLHDQVPLHQWDVMPVWLFAAGTMLLFAVVAIWILAFF